MPQLSPNIGLPLYDRTTDKPELFIDYRDNVNGTGSTSGFSIIDDKFGEVDTTLDILKGVGWTDESLVENAQAIATLKEKGVYTAFASGTNTLTATITDFAGAPPNNAVIILVPSALNTTTVTLSINSETAKPLTVPRGKSGTVSYDALSAKDLRPNVPMIIRKSSDGVRYVVVGFGESYAKDVFYDNGGGTYTDLQTKITTITPVVPTETVITSGFASGWSGTLRLRKNQEGQKLLMFEVTKTTDIGSSDTAYTLASDFWPPVSNYVNVNGYTSSPTIINGSNVQVSVLANGNLVIKNIGSVTANVRFCVGTIVYY